jgi:hypothetical protein
MTREQANHCRKHHVSVEVPGDEDFKTGFVIAVLAPHHSSAIVTWDDDTQTVVLLRNLVVQYPEQLEAVA